MSKLICPNCGSEVVLPEHSSICAGVTLSEKDTQGTIYLNMKKENTNMNKATEKRMEALRQAGIDTTGFFTIPKSNGDEVIMKWENGIPTVVEAPVVEEDDDPVVNRIIENGYVRNCALHRRFLAAQYWKMCQGAGYSDHLKGYGYNYCITYMIEEMDREEKIQRSGDIDTLLEIQQFFNWDVVVKVLGNYLYDVREYVTNEVPVKHCKGIEYVHVNGKNIFCEDLQKKLYSPMQQGIDRVNRLRTVDALRSFYKHNYFCLPKTMPDGKTRTKSKAWVDAFKGAGAYYFAKNVILFDGVRVPGMNCSESYKELQKKCKEYKKYGYYQLHAWVQKLVKDTKFDLGQYIKSQQ